MTEISSARRTQERSPLLTKAGQCKKNTTASVIANNPVYQADQVFGQEKEKELLPILSKYFNFVLKPKHRYFVFDYECDTAFIELKSRRGIRTEYPTTIVGKNKIDYADKCNKDVYFVFNFSDGLFYWKYDKEEIGKRVKIGLCGRVDRGKREIKEYCFVDVELLISIPL